MSKQSDSEDLISIIIPIYNIEPYLKRCVDSVLCQTYRNLEIILVDDGSTDGSGRLCDQYEESDTRVRVIHKTNGGQADARNRGIDIASGEYVLFVDGDDYIAPWHVELLYLELKKADADVSCCDFLKSSNDSVVWPECRNNYRVLGAMEAVYAMLYVRNITTAPFCKLFRRELFNDIWFPKGQIYEDLATVYKVVSKANRIAWTEDKTYCYFQRIGSTVNSPVTYKNMAAFSFLQEIELYFPGNQKLKKAVSSHYINLCIDFLKNRQSEAGIDIKIWEYVKDKRMDVLLNMQAPLRVRAFSVLSFSGRKLTKRILNLYYKAL